MTAEVLFFIIVAVAAISGALIMLWSRYIVHSAFGLLLSFLGIAGIYTLLGYAFLAITQIVVYVGGVVVLYLFGVMLTPPDLEERKKGRILFWAVLGLIAFVVLAGYLFSGNLPAMKPQKPMEDVSGIGSALLEKDKFLLPFEIASLLLLVVLVGAVHLARREKIRKGEES